MRHTALLLALATLFAGCAGNPTATSTTIGPGVTAAASAASLSATSLPVAASAASAASASSAASAASSSAVSASAALASSASTSPVPAAHSATAATTPQPVVPSVTPRASAPGASAASIASIGSVAPTAPTAAPQTGTPKADSPNASGGFSTRHAYYEPTRFADLPGWDADDLGASWDAFRRSCAVLGTRNGWSEACSASRPVDARNAAAIRQFFETYFNAYQIRDTDRSIDGTLTGYYEPLLNGSRQYGGAYIYPVYGTPDDMLYLNARRVPERARGGTIAARIDGRTVVPLTDISLGNLKGVYVLDLGDSVPDIRDKKFRMRLDHERIVPYYTRAEIERGALKAPILAYVDDPVMLYSMQVQGSGKVRMRDGSIRRFAYAEQNGRPFLPPVAGNSTGRSTGTGNTHRLVVRGIDMQIDVSNDDAPTAAADASGGASSADEDADTPVSPLLRGFRLAAAAPSAEGSVTQAVTHAAAARTTSGSGTSGSSRPGSGTSNGLVPGSVTAGSSMAGTPPIRHSFATSDPSYVFFRLIPDSPNGPVGALGVPLSAGRSVAVDPRTTPLGAPVFVATRDDPRTPGAIDRLMLAQDSGGAIRGAVRADYFYGFGENAQALASHTKERVRMWVLLPKGLHIAAQEATLKTRGIGPAVSNADCLVSDPDLCVDDAP